MPSTRTNWHEAVTCAIQIDLRDYSHLLEYDTEHYLSSNRNRIDLLIIRKQVDFHIPKHIASIFRTHNIFEYKGLGSSLTKYTYYKTNAHAGYYINSLSKTSAIDRRDVTLTFPTFHYPRNLFRHLTKECNITIENPFPGVYYINREMYATQVLVIKELSPEDSMYLHCLTKNLNNQNLINDLADDYALNKSNTLYTQYMNQFLGFHMKGEKLMVCENLFRLYGTSSAEIAEKAATQATKLANEQAQKLYVPQIQKLTSENNQLTLENNQLNSENNQLNFENNFLKQLLLKNNIAY